MSLTLAGAPRTDVFAQRPEQPDVLLAIQVKAERGGGFFLGRELEDISPGAEAEWFVLVSLREAGALPRFFILPRLHLAAAVGTAIIALGDRFRQLGHRNFDGYEDNWDQLLEPAGVAAWRPPAWHWDHRSSWRNADAVGMPTAAPQDAPVR